MKLFTRIFIILFLIPISLSFSQTYFGNFTSYKIQGKSIRIYSDSSSVNLIFYQPDILRVDFYPTVLTKIDSSFAVIQDTATASGFSVTENDTTLEVSSQLLKIICNKNPLRFSFYNSNNIELLKEPETGGIETNGIQRSVNFILNQDEHFYGTGERGTSLDKRGQAFDSYNSQIGGYNSPLPTMNINIPFIASNYGFGIFFDNTYKGRFDLGYSDPTKFSYTVYGGELTFYIIAAPNIPNQLEKYTWLTGRQPLPPKWAFGYIQSKFGYRNEAAAQTMIQTMRNYKIPCDAIVLDLFWYRNMGDVSWDLSNWPNPNLMMSDFFKEGIKTIAITEPYITSSSSNYTFANNSGYFAKNTNGSSFVFNNWWSCGCNASLIDITNPSAQSWWWSKYPIFMDTLMAGFWTDLGEPERDDVSIQFFIGSDNKVHNIYNLLWAKIIYNGFKNYRPDQRIFNLTRSGFAGIQRYGVIPWFGDVGKDFGGLAVQIPMLLNMGMSGLAYHNSDIGGFTNGKTTPELYTRWMEYGTFCPITRAHGYDVIQNTEPWTFDDTTLAICKKYIQLRYELLPYIYTMAYENYQTGMPLARPLFFSFPNDNNLSNESSSYMWGDNFLVSPVVQSGQTSKTIYLPEGNWIDYWSDKNYSGGQSITTSTPIEKLPLFIKEGSIIPMQQIMDYSDEYPLDTLVLEVYPSKTLQAKFNLYEDDGKTTAYQTGNFAQTEFLSNVTSSNSNMDLNFSIGPSIGNYSGKPKQRIYVIDFHLITGKPNSVSVNGNEIQVDSTFQIMRTSTSGYFYDENENKLYVQILTVPDSSYTIKVKNIFVDVKGKKNLGLLEFKLSQNYPNPFNPTTTINYTIAKSGNVKLAIYNILGQEIESLVNEYKNAGEYKIEFDAHNLPSGIYIYKLISGDFIQSRKMIFIK